MSQPNISNQESSFEHAVAAASIFPEPQKSAEYLQSESTGSNTHLAELIETQRSIQSLPPGDALRRIVTLALKLIPAQGAGIWVFTGDALVYRAGAGACSDGQTLKTAVLSGLATGKPRPFQDDTVSSTEYRSLLAVPVLQGSKVSGVLAVFSEKANVFTEQHVAIIQLLAGFLSHAMDKAEAAKFKHMVMLERAVVRQVIDSVVPELSENRNHSNPDSHRGSPATEYRPLPLDFQSEINPEALALLAEEFEKFGNLGVEEETTERSAAGQPETEELLCLIGSEAAPPRPELNEPGKALEGPISDFVSDSGEEVMATHDPKSGFILSWLQSLKKEDKSSAVLGELEQVGQMRQPEPDFNQLTVAETAIALSPKEAPRRRLLKPALTGLAALALLGLLSSVKLRTNKVLAHNSSPTTSIIKVAIPVSRLEVSHRRITDANVAATVENLSPYEIPTLRRQAEFGDPSAAFVLGMAYETGRGVRQNCGEAARWVSEAATQGDRAAAYNLGLRYRDGDGVRQDPSESERWMKKASEPSSRHNPR